MNPEKKSSNINLEGMPHTGNLEGDLQELPHTEDVPSVQEFQDLNTGELKQVMPTPETSGELILTDSERGPFQDKLAALRETHAEAPKSHTRLYAGILAGTLVLGGGVTAATVIANQGQTHEQPSDNGQNANKTANATASPNVSPSSIDVLKSQSATPEQELTPKSLELPASLTPEQLGTAFVQDRLSAWEMAGATQANMEKYFQQGGPDTFTQDIAAKNAEIFGDGLFVPGWRDNPQLSMVVGNIEKVDALSTELNFITDYSSSSNIKDKEQYRRSMVVGSTTVLSETADTRVLNISAADHDNASKNSAGDHSKGTNDINGNKFAIKATFKLVDGAWKIAGYETGNLQ